MSYCSNCGAEVAEGEKFCHKCGTQLATEPAAEETHNLNDQFDEPAQGGTQNGQTAGNQTANSQPSQGQPAQQSYSPLSIVSLVLGIVSIVLSFFWIGFFTAIGGLVCGIIAMNKAKEAGDDKSRSFGKIGVILSSVAMGIVVLWFIIGVGAGVCTALSGAYYYY